MAIYAPLLIFLADVVLDSAFNYLVRSLVASGIGAYNVRNFSITPVMSAAISKVCDIVIGDPDSAAQVNYTKQRISDLAHIAGPMTSTASIRSL
ncbi:hypothetical protein N7454_004897 [Penicillium verhagenii]|nr:hypothetical protein N7454_004897 [Penicillium verhagenii]